MFDTFNFENVGTRPGDETPTLEAQETPRAAEDPTAQGETSAGIPVNNGDQEQ